MSLLRELCKSADESVDEKTLTAAAETAEKGSFLEAVVRYLLGGRNRNVYGSAEGVEAFKTFVRGGGNVPLYEACREKVVNLLTKAPQTNQRRPIRFLDLGCGSGQLLIPLLERWKPRREMHITLVDTSPLADGLVERVRACLPEGSVVRHLQMSFKDFCREVDDDFDVCLSSFALHYSVGLEREHILDWISFHCQRFLLIEFDVDGERLQRTARDDPARFRWLLDKYQIGADEYADSEKDLVVDHFLAPVFAKNFSPDLQSMEQSAVEWKEAMLKAGMKRVQVETVYRYWWADCVILDAWTHNQFDSQPFVSESLAVVEVQGMGRGYRATRAIAEHEVLLVEKPLILDLEDEGSRYHGIGHVVSNGIASPEAAYEWIRENSFISGKEVHVYAKRYLFNHSCWPNAASDGITVAALRPINCGEDVTITYVEGVLHSWRTAVMLLPTPLRAVHLQKEIFGFECLCKRCRGLDAQDVERMLDGVEDLPPKFRQMVSNASALLEESAKRSRIEPLLPSLACTTLEKRWLDECLLAFERYFPPNFPATNKLRKMMMTDFIAP